MHTLNNEVFLPVNSLRVLVSFLAPAHEDDTFTVAVNRLNDVLGELFPAVLLV